MARSRLVPRHAILALGVLSLAVAAAIAIARTFAAFVAAGLAVLTVTIVTGLIQARAGLRGWLAPLVAPWYVAFNALVRVRALAGLPRSDRHCGRTARV